MATVKLDPANGSIRLGEMARGSCGSSADYVTGTVLESAGSNLSAAALPAHSALLREQVSPTSPKAPSSAAHQDRASAASSTWRRSPGRGRRARCTPSTLRVSNTSKNPAAPRAFSRSGVSFEQTGGFGLPADIDRSFDRLVSALTAAVATWSTPAPEHP